MKIKRLMAGLLCGAVGAATLGLSGCGNAADSGMMDAANANAVAGGSSDLPVITWKMGSTWGDGNIHFTCDERFSELVSQLTDGRFTITNYPEGKSETVTVENNPLDPAAGTREIAFSRNLWIESDDFLETPVPKYKRLYPNGPECRLKGAYLIRCTGCVKDENGSVTEVLAEYDPESRGGDPADGRKVRGATIHWVDAATAIDAEVRLYDNLFTDADPDAADKNFLECLNPNSLEVLTGCKVEPSLADAAAPASFQFMRLGYFCLDSKDSKPGHLVFNRSVSLKDSFKK